MTAPFRSSQNASRTWSSGVTSCRSTSMSVSTASQTLNSGVKSSLRACEVQPPGQGGIKILAAVWSPCEHAASIPAVFVHEPVCASVHQQNGGHSSCMQILVRTVHTVQQTVFWGWLFTRLLLCSDRCPGWGAQKTVEFRSCRFSGVAQCLVRLWIHVLHHPGWLLEEFYDFPRDLVDSDPEVNSRRSLHTWPMRK